LVPNLAEERIVAEDQGVEEFHWWVDYPSFEVTAFSVSPFRNPGLLGRFVGAGVPGLSQKP
jgi:hypothetical protein